MTATHNTSTRIPARLLGLTALAILGLAAPPAAHAQLTTLFSFSVANGYYPAAGLTLSGTTLYGTTGGAARAAMAPYSPCRRAGAPSPPSPPSTTRTGPTPTPS